MEIGSRLLTAEGPGRSLIAYAAAAWGFLFAVPNFYWGMGGEFGTGTIARDIDAFETMSDRTVVFLTGVPKVVAGAVALLLALRPVPRPFALVVAAGGALVVVYGVLNLAEHALMLAGVLEIEERLGRTAVYWHTAFWDPLWILGGLLFIAAGLSARRA